VENTICDEDEASGDYEYEEFDSYYSPA